MEHVVNGEILIRQDASFISLRGVSRNEFSVLGIYLYGLRNIIYAGICVFKFALFMVASSFFRLTFS